MISSIHHPHSVLLSLIAILLINAYSLPFTFIIQEVLPIQMNYDKYLNTGAEVYQVSATYPSIQTI